MLEKVKLLCKFLKKIPLGACDSIREAMYIFDLPFEPREVRTILGLYNCYLIFYEHFEIVVT